MGFEEVERSGDIVIEARHLSKAFDTPLFQDLSVAVLRGQCVGVMGPNGSGKTTLIKTLIGREKADQGEVKLGHKVQVGYHDQGLQSLSPSTTVVRAVWPEDDPDWVEGDVRNLLARFGLTGEIVFQTVGQLSGGEKAKAALARLCATAANLLVMDEPTNHLDIWSCEALERSIREFEGTVLVVSHDRYFLNKVADRLVVLGDGRARVIEGDYETYQHLIQQEKEAAAEQSPRQGRPPCPAVRQSPPTATAAPRRNSPTARPPTSSARSASWKTSSPRSRTCSASPQPGATPSRPSGPRTATSSSRPAWKRFTSTGNTRSKRTGRRSYPAPCRPPRGPTIGINMVQRGRSACNSEIDARTCDLRTEHSALRTSK